MMTLAGMAYGQPPAIRGNLESDVLTKSEWSLFWMAEDLPARELCIHCAKRQDRRLHHRDRRRLWENLHQHVPETSLDPLGVHLFLMRNSAKPA